MNSGAEDMSAELEFGFRLKGEKGVARGQAHAFQQERVRLGREAPCELVIKDETVSRHHATITFDGQRYHLADEGSANGTFLNGSRVRGLQPLAVGDVIGLGPDQRLRFEFDGAAAGAAASGAATSGVLGSLKQRPALAGMLAVYVLAILALALFLGLRSKKGDRISPHDVDDVVARNEEYLKHLERPVDGVPAGDCSGSLAAVKQGRIIEDTVGQDPGALFVAFTRYRAALAACEVDGVDAGDKADDEGVGPAAAAAQQALNRIGGTLRDALFAAWLLESQARPQDARLVYERVLLVVPDEKAPSHHFARERLRVLKAPPRKRR